MPQFKILLVDDSPNILKALERTFKSEDYALFTAESSIEALAILEKTSIDLIISDEHMPGCSGSELLKRTCELYPDVIRFMITGLTDIEVVKSAINKGEIYRFFTKPWDDFELLISVKYALKQKGLKMENKTLRKAVEKQDQILSKLEKENPGITKVNLTENGAIVLDTEG